MQALVALMLLAQPTLDSTPPTPSATEATSSAQPGQPVDRADELVCRRERVIGSNIPVEVCQRRGDIVRRAERTGRILRGRPGLAGGRPVGTNVDD